MEIIGKIKKWQCNVHFGWPTFHCMWSTFVKTINLLLRFKVKYISVEDWWVHAVNNPHQHHQSKNITQVCHSNRWPSQILLHLMHSFAKWPLNAIVRLVNLLFPCVHKVGHPIKLYSKSLFLDCLSPVVRYSLFFQGVSVL